MACRSLALFACVSLTAFACGGEPPVGRKKRRHDDAGHDHCSKGQEEESQDAEGLQPGHALYIGKSRARSRY
jgi:hypothetical protein